MTPAARAVSAGGFAGVLLVCCAVTTGACTDPQTVLTQQIEARRVAADLQVQFSKAAEAANRAVMADTDQGAAAAVAEAKRARDTVGQDSAALRGILEGLRYQDDLRHLDSFRDCFEQYRRLDDTILPLAVENTNVKAQRLSFGPATDAADAFRAALAAALQHRASQDFKSEALAARAGAALLQVQVLHAPHIAEADLAAMDRLEERMAASEKEARAALRELSAALPSAAAGDLAAAQAALDRFAAVNKELVSLSRRNSDVHSLALSLGEKRVIAAQCDAHLQALSEAIAKHAFTATR